MSKQIISTHNAPAAIGVYSQAVRVGNTIWVSGQIPLDPPTKELVTGGIDLKPVTVLRGVGHGLAARLHALGVETTQDLLFLLPLRYEDRTRVALLGELKPGQRAAVEGEVLLTEIVFRGRRQMLCRIGDGSGFLTLRFFYF